MKNKIETPIKKSVFMVLDIASGYFAESSAGDAMTVSHFSFQTEANIYEFQFDGRKEVLLKVDGNHDRICATTFCRVRKLLFCTVRPR